MEIFLYLNVVEFSTHIFAFKEEYQYCQWSGTDNVPYYVYVILCEGNCFYTGYTKNLSTRLRLHLRGRGAKYTRMHKPRKLVHAEEFGTRSEAMKREKRIKKLNHSQKMRLTRGQRGLKNLKRKKLPL